MDRCAPALPRGHRLPSAVTVLELVICPVHNRHMDAPYLPRLLKSSAGLLALVMIPLSVWCALGVLGSARRHGDVS